MTTVNKTALKKFPLMTPTMGKDVKNAITKYFAQVTAHTSMECCLLYTSDAADE